MLARKISRGKWERKSHLSGDEISADAITVCLRTLNDALSWWKCSDDEKDVAEVALAVGIAVDKEKQQLDKIDIVVVPDTDLESVGLSFQPTPGNTLIEDLRERHIDVVYFDLERIARVARILAPRIRSRTRVFTFPLAKVKSLIRDAITAKRLTPDKLSEQVLEKLGYGSTL
jgi:hypothetical protein